MADSSSLRRTAPRTGVRSVGDGVGLGIGDWGLGIGESGIGNRESGAALQLGCEPARHVTRRGCPDVWAAWWPAGGRRLDVGPGCTHARLPASTSTSSRRHLGASRHFA
ncbi:hypothetical protein DFG55_12305 [Xanthomonas campestris pv. campestris]|nr:hypothetical protein DFG55_12305 [Xanthomonas campestris pv. campestris]QCX72408.1 hypothetical protein DFG54_18115 [Xanthomonas campestris pv. campestris]